MLRGIKTLVATVIATVLLSVPVGAISLSSLEKVSEDSEQIEILTPEEGYDFDANFLAKNQELKYKTTIENDEELPIRIDNISLNESEYNFLEYSFDGITNNEIIEPGESKDLFAIIKTNTNNTSTVSEDYNLTLTYTKVSPTPEPEEDHENPETATTAVIRTSTIALISIGAITFIFARNKRIRSYAVLFMATSLGICILATNATAEEAASTLSILGKVRFTNIYNVTVNPNGGTYSGELTATRREGEKFHIDDVSREHFEFVEWEINPTNTPDENNDIEIHADTTIKAKWNENTYTLTIRPNGGEYLGSTDDWSESYRPLENATISTPEMEGYDFVDWTVEEGSIGQDGHFDGSNISMTEDITLVANYKIKTFTVTVIPNGGTYHESTDTFTTTVDWNTDYEIESISRDGYDLKNWTKTVGEDNATLEANTQSVNIKADTTLTANWWSSTFYTVTIVPNGGVYDGDLETQVRAGEKYTMQSIDRDEFLFDYWHYTNTDTHMNEEEFIVNENVSLTAEWLPIVAKIVRNGEFYKFYPSIMAAHDEAITDDVIVLLVDTSEVVTNQKQVTLDLNAHTVYGYLTNTADGNLILLNGEINNYEESVINENNPDGAAVINNGTLTMGVDNYLEDDDNHKEPIINNNYVRLIGTNVGLQQNNIFYYYDGFIEGEIGLVGGYDGSPWYREAFDGVEIHFFPFVTHNNTKDCQHVELSNSDRSVSKTTVHGDIYYYNLQDNINTSAKTGYQIYAVRDFDGSYPITVAEGDEITFDVIGYNVNLGETVTNNGTLTITDSKTGDDAGILNSAKTITNNGTLKLEDAKIAASTANALLLNNGSLNMTNSTLSSDNGHVIRVTKAGTTISADEDSYIKATKSDTNAILNDSTDLTLASGNVQGYNCAVKNNGGKTFTITGGIISGTESAICNDGGTVNVNGGTVKASRWGENKAINTKNGTLNVRGGLVESRNTEDTSGYQSNYAIYSNSSTINITGGEVKATTSNRNKVEAIYVNWGTLNIDGENTKLTTTATNSASAIGIDFYNTATLNLKNGAISINANSGSATFLTGVGGSNYSHQTGGTVTVHSNSNNAIGIDTLSNSYGVMYEMTGGSINATSDTSSKLGIGIRARVARIVDGYVYGSIYGIEGKDYNTSNIYIGTNDETLYNGQNGIDAKPIIKGGTYGVDNGNVYFYDGILKGGVKYINSESQIIQIPDATKKIVTDYTDPEVEQDCWLVAEEDYLLLENGERRNSLSKAFKDAGDGETITVYKDMTTSATISANTKNLILDLDGHTLNYTNTITNSGTLTITDGSRDKNGKISNTGTVTFNNNGTLILENGTINGNSCPITNNPGKTFTMTGGLVTSTNGAICADGATTNIRGGTVRSTYVDVWHPGTIDVDGGTVNVSDGLIEITGGGTEYAAIYTNDYNHGRSTINITGGELKATSSYQPVNAVNIARTSTIVNIDGENTKLGATNTGSGKATVLGGGATFNVKNGTLSAESNTGDACLSNAYSTINISGGTMNIHSTAGNAYGTNQLQSYSQTVTMTGGSLNATTDSSSKSGIGFANMNVVITDGAVYGSTYGINGYDSYFNATATVRIGTNDETIYNGQDGIEAKPIIKGGKYAINNGNIYFYDGILKGGEKYINNETAFKAIPDGTSRIVTDYTDPEVEQDCWLKADEDYIHLESNNRDYNSLTAALANAAATDTMTIFHDASTEAVLPTIDKNITIELDGNTLFYTQPIKNSGTLTIQDSSRDKTGKIQNSNTAVSVIENNGTLNIISGSFSGYDCVIKNNSGKTFTLTDGKISGNESAICNYGGTLNINGGTVETNPTVKSKIIKTEYGTINIAGGLVQSTGATTINAIDSVRDSNDNITMTGGEIKLTSSDEINVFGGRGTLTINGANAKINAIGTGNEAASVFDRGGTIAIMQGTISAKTINNTAKINDNNATFTVSGGTMTAHSTNGNAYGFYDLRNQGCSINVSGGAITATSDNADKLGIGIGCSSTTVSDGTIKGSTYGISGTNGSYVGTVTIGTNDGTIYNGQNGNPAKPIIIGGVYGINSGYVSLYDGLLKGGVDGYYDRNIKVIADNSYMKQSTETIDGEEYIVKYLAEEENLAKIGTGTCDTTGTTCYASLQAAINASSENDTITLLQDNYIFGATSVSTGKKFTLDTSGYNIITSGSITNNGNMTIVNSQKATSNPVIDYRENERFILNKNGATLSINDIKLKSSNKTIVSEAGSTTNLNDVTIQAGNNAVEASGPLTITNSNIQADNNAVIVSGSQLGITNSAIAADTYAVSVSNGTTGTISGSTLTSYGSDAYYSTGSSNANNPTDITITNTTVNGTITNNNNSSSYSKLSLVDSTVSKSDRNALTLIYNQYSGGTITIDNSTLTATDTYGNGSNQLRVIVNGGTLNIQNNSILNLNFNGTTTLGRNARIIENSGTLSITDSTINNTVNNSTSAQQDNGITYGIVNTGTISDFSSSTIELTRYHSVGIDNASGSTQINSGQILARGTISEGIYVRTGAVTLGAAETDPSKIGTENAGVSTTLPYIEAIGTSAGRGVLMDTGSFNYYDGKIAQNTNLGPAVNLNNYSQKATISNVEYWYEPMDFEDGNGHYYFILDFMRQQP